MKKKRIENFIFSMNDELGQGSFGKVYKGFNELNKQSVAIKVLSKKMLQEDEYVKEAIISQIKIMRKLKSEHIVGFIDILQTQNNYYIVQEYCSGGDLRASLKKMKSFPEKQAIAFLEQICTGFLELTKNFVIHRDMKPENILIHEGRLKLADFGFAKNVLSRSQFHKSMVGTPLYMAPQVLKRQKYSSKCDIWGVGLIFYELLFGTIPWTGKSEYELVTNVMKIPLTFPKQPAVSEDTVSFLRGCLKVEEKDRFGWIEVYSHPIFKGKFRDFVDKSKQLKDKAGYVINKLRLQIHSQNIDVEKLFNKLKYTEKESLGKGEFFKLLDIMGMSLDEQEKEYLFDKFDTDGNGTIELQEFKNCLSENGVRLTSIKAPAFQKKETMLFNDEEDPVSPLVQENQRVNGLILKLRNKIEQHKVDLYSVYTSYDKNRDESLSFTEFAKLIKKIDNTLNENEQQLVFNKFDINGDKEISFDEFMTTLCKIAGEPLKLIKGC